MHYAKSPTDPNCHMVPVIGEIKEEYSNLEPVNFVSTDKVKYGTDGTLPILSYKDAIATINQVNNIIDHNILLKINF